MFLANIRGLRPTKARMVPRIRIASDRTNVPNHARNTDGERGMVTLLAMGGAVALLGLAALAIDVGYAVLTRTELQNIADTGAASGSRELARLYDEKGPTTNYQKYTLTSADKARIISNINEFAQQNKAAGKNITIGTSDVVFGTYNRATGQITATDKGVEAVQVRARRDGTANGPVDTFLASILGVNTVNVSAGAANAGVSSVSAIPAGKGDVPIGIAKAWFTARDSPCGTDAGVRFHPTGTTVGCAGWHVFTETPANASKLRSIIDGLRIGTFTPPAMVAGATYFTFTGGTVASAYDEFEELYDAKKDASGNWRVLIPVYDSDDCKNPHGSTLIIGFAKARIYNVKKHQIDANVECDVIEFGTGDNTEYYGTAVGKPRAIQ